MTGPSFVDANVFLYTQDRRDLAKHKRAEEWLDSLWRSALGRTSIQALSEYLHDLRHPKENYNRSSFKPLVERNPLVFWKVVSLVLACVVAFLLFKLRLHS